LLPAKKIQIVANSDQCTQSGGTTLGAPDRSDGHPQEDRTSLVNGTRQPCAVPQRKLRPCGGSPIGFGLPSCHRRPAPAYRFVPRPLRIKKTIGSAAHRHAFVSPPHGTVRPPLLLLRPNWPRANGNAETASSAAANEVRYLAKLWLISFLRFLLCVLLLLVFAQLRRGVSTEGELGARRVFLPLILSILLGTRLTCSARPSLAEPPGRIMKRNEQQSKELGGVARLPDVV
jgi:hypothetical protein